MHSRRQAMISLRLKNISFLIIVCCQLTIRVAKGQHISITDSIAGAGFKGNSKEVDFSGLGEDNDFYDFDTIEVRLTNNGPIEQFKREVGSKSRDVPMHAETENKKYSLELARVNGPDGIKAISGVINHLEGNEIYRFSTDANGVDRISVHSVDDFPEDEEPLRSNNRDRFRHLRGKDPNNISPANAIENVEANITETSFDDRSLLQKAQIDVMFLWSAKAECKNAWLDYPCVLTKQTIANMDAVVKAAIAETNAAFELSGINAELNLATAYRHPTYIEYDNERTATANAVRDLMNGNVPEISAMREQYGADMVHMIVDSREACGNGAMGPGIDSMFSVSDIDCTVAYDVFAHEVGHNLGASHDRGTENACDSNRNNFGYRGDRYRTLMSYPCRTGQCDNDSDSGSCRRVLRFSHPGRFNGVAIGDEMNNNAGRIQAAVNEVEKYYRRPTIMPPRPAMEFQERDPNPPQLSVENCFSPYATVIVKEKEGTIKMKDLRVGDQVLTSSGEYQTVYTFDHFHKSKSTIFTRIQTESNEQPLEVTPNHMLFVEGKSYPVPASQIKVHDVLQSIQGPAVVTNIESITRDGFYNPLTADGTIIVDGIIASTYTSYDGNSHIEVAGFDILPIHAAVDIAAVPYRSFCMILSSGFDYCNQHDGYAGASIVIRQLYLVWLEQSDFVKCIICFAYVLCFGLISAFVRFHVLSAIIASGVLTWRAAIVKRR